MESGDIDIGKGNEDFYTSCWLWCLCIMLNVNISNQRLKVRQEKNYTAVESRRNLGVEASFK
jgi:hypothetical protein